MRCRFSHLRKALAPVRASSVCDDRCAMRDAAQALGRG
jgi:hypothetical protein